MFNQETDETLMRAQRCAMDAQRHMLFAVFAYVGEADFSGHIEVHLVRRKREFTSNGAPDFHINLWSVECRFIRYFDKIDPRLLHNFSHHVLRLLPERRFVHIFLAKTFGIME